MTGGAALAGFWLHHRTTSDLDLFTLDDDAFERAPHVVVDLVRERVPQLHAEKAIIDGIAVDPPDEILANKLTALVGRQEERDLVDVMFLERQLNLRVEDLLPAALAKDGGATPATLAWLLSELSIPDSAKLPAGSTPEELRGYLTKLIPRLRQAARPAVR